MTNWNFPKTSKTAMEEALTMSAGFPRDQFTKPMIIQKPFRNIGISTVNHEDEKFKKLIPYKFLIVAGIIGGLVLVLRK